ncbi:CpaD family pilus assembly lipoprotein [Sneathiella glossodoripedis]|uniref:CpaD family pilus assembly lipoprotein n=1 Tax=Sneathiella glossodoripedis TaxID=418853 RepID=UPI0004707EF4|nr:CpaD family pilus assembly lipoprotein [Sneathiella glossodoripedis]
MCANGPDTGRPAELRASPATANMAKQINVQVLTPTFVTRFDSSGAEFSDLEKGRLLGFLQAQGIKFGEEVYLELPPFDDPGGVNEQRFGAVGSFLQDQGLKVSPKIVGDGLRNSLRVYYSKYVATADPKCAKGWHRPAGTSYENLPLPNMGCATASAFAQMVANPKDLVSPAQIGGYDGERAAKSILKYKLGGKSSTTGGGSEESGSSEGGN